MFSATVGVFNSSIEVIKWTNMKIKQNRLHCINYKLILIKATIKVISQEQWVIFSLHFVVLLTLKDIPLRTSGSVFTIATVSLRVARKASNIHAFDKQIYSFFSSLLSL